MKLFTWYKWVDNNQPAFPVFKTAGRNEYEVYSYEEGRWYTIIVGGSTPKEMPEGPTPSRDKLRKLIKFVWKRAN